MAKTCRETPPIPGVEAVRLPGQQGLARKRSALAEGIALAETLGLDLDVFLAAIRRSAAYSAVMDGKADMMRRRVFVPEGRVEQSLKDTRLMLARAHDRGQRLPLTEVQVDLLEGCVAAGDGDRDSAVVIEEIRRRGYDSAKSLAGISGGRRG